MIDDDQLDPTDRRILAILQASARTQNADIARQVAMAPSAVLERIRKLERRGVIEGYHARVAAAKLGLGLVAFISVKTNESMDQMCTGQALARIPEVLEVHHVAGDDCYLVKVRTRDPEALGRLLREKLGTISTVTATRSTIVLETIKEDPSLAWLDDDGGRDDG